MVSASSETLNKPWMLSSITHPRAKIAATCSKSTSLLCCMRRGNSISVATCWACRWEDGWNSFGMSRVTSGRHLRNLRPRRYVKESIWPTMPCRNIWPIMTSFNLLISSPIMSLIDIASITQLSTSIRKYSRRWNGSPGIFAMPWEIND